MQGVGTIFGPKRLMMMRYSQQPGRLLRSKPLRPPSYGQISLNATCRLITMAINAVDQTLSLSGYKSRSCTGEGTTSPIYSLCRNCRVQTIQRKHIKAIESIQKYWKYYKNTAQIKSRLIKNLTKLIYRTPRGSCRYGPVACTSLVERLVAPS